MGKRSINNIAGVGIIFREQNPREVFLEMKDEEYSVILFRDTLSLIGGNWSGANAQFDSNPLETYRREEDEELTFIRDARSTAELRELGLSSATTSVKPTPIAPVEVMEFDKLDLHEIKQTISRYCCPFIATANTITKEAMDRADPGNTKQTFTSLVCYFATSLREEIWKNLERLQSTFGNLSNESVTLITSVDEMIARGTKGAFGHDQVLKKFWLAMGIPEAKNLPITEGVEVEDVGTALASYSDYLDRYNIANKPTGVS